MATLHTTMTTRLADEDALIATLQRQIAEPTNDPEAPVESDTDGV